jgi:predicted metal-dependent phosphoesterase TrpH
MRMDLHCHSEASHDCLTPISSFPARLRARGISVQAITDHNEVWGAQKLKALAEGTDLTVIVGEEVSTAEGEIVGLFLTEKISRGLSPEETVAHIKGQGGLVLLPHGLDPLKRHRLKPQALDRIADSIDIVEAFNARISRPSWNRAAANWADERGLAKSAGSDSHVLKDLGDAWVEAPLRPINGPADLMAALKDGVVMGEWTHPLIALAGKAWDYARRGFRRVPAT